MGYGGHCISLSSTGSDSLSSVVVEQCVDPNVFETANAGFAQAIYEEYLRDPSAVSPEWRRLFESGVVGESPSSNGNGASPPVAQAGPSTGA